ncbi:hypothetical protein OKW18_006713 [Streptomyces pratensis]|nr:hypothetical protein [Streptomyces pratensis]
MVYIRRARRAKTAAQIDLDLPGLSDAKRRPLIEDQLREQTAREAEVSAARQEETRPQQARRDEARAADQEQAKRERTAAAAADTARQTLACEDCGLEQTAGRCEACSYRRRTEALIAEAGMVVATWSADLTDQNVVATQRPGAPTGALDLLNRLSGV